MAFTLEVIRGSTTYNISAGQPIAIEELDDLGGASVRVLEERGPFQDGASHLGYRLEPRVMTLRLNVVGASASALDGHRDTLNAMFKPVNGVPIILKVTRDDGEIRYLDCERTGPLGIPLNRMDRPGNVHRAVVQLRAADPLFYDPNEEETAFSVAVSWWLAYNTIGTADVASHVENPPNRQISTLAMSLGANTPRTIALRTSHPGTADKLVFDFGQSEISSLGTAQIRAKLVSGGTADFAAAAGTANYFFAGAAGTASNLNVYIDDNTTPAVTIGGTTFTSGISPVWRGNEAGGTANDWTPAMPYGAVYNIVLSTAQRLALDASMESGGSAFTGPIIYAGDMDTYPVITITGPYGNPVITNGATGDVLDFTGGTVGSADTWTIDTRYGHKSVVNAAGSSVLQYLSADSDLATFRLVPDPTAAGGLNSITVAGSASGSASVTIAYYNRYLGF